MNSLFLHYKNEENQGWYLKDDNQNDESNEILLLPSQKVEKQYSSDRELLQ